MHQRTLNYEIVMKNVSELRDWQLYDILLIINKRETGINYIKSQILFLACIQYFNSRRSNSNSKYLCSLKYQCCYSRTDFTC